MNYFEAVAETVTQTSADITFPLRTLAMFWHHVAVVTATTYGADILVTAGIVVGIMVYAVGNIHADRLRSRSDARRRSPLVTGTATAPQILAAARNRVAAGRRGVLTTLDGSGARVAHDDDRARLHVVRLDGHTTFLPSPALAAWTGTAPLLTVSGRRSARQRSRDVAAAWQAARFRQDV